MSKRCHDAEKVGNFVLNCMQYICVLSIHTTIFQIIFVDLIYTSTRTTPYFSTFCVDFHSRFSTSCVLFILRLFKS